MTPDNAEDLAEVLTGESDLHYKRRKFFEQLLPDASAAMADDVAKATDAIEFPTEWTP